MQTSLTYAELADHERVAEDLEAGWFARFRDEWLPSIVDEPTWARLRDLPEQYLALMYPRLYVQGVTAPLLERTVAKVQEFLSNPRVDPEEKTRFCLGLWHTYRSRWSELEDAGEWDALHEACARVGLGGAMIRGSYLTKIDVDALLQLVNLHMLRTTGKAAESVENALYVFTQMVLLRNLIQVGTLRCEQTEYDEDGMEGVDGYDEYAEGITTLEPLIQATKLFAQHDVFMTEWGLA